MSNDPFAQLPVANLQLQTRGAVLHMQVVKRVRARRAALRPALLDISPLFLTARAVGAVGCGVKTALRALTRTWHEPRLTSWRRAAAAAYLRPFGAQGATTAGMGSAKVGSPRQES